MDYQIQQDMIGRQVAHKMHTEFWWGNPMETDHAAKLGRDVRRILKWILQKQNEWV